MKLKVTYERDAVLKEILASDPEIARLRGSTHDRDEVESREVSWNGAQELSSSVVARNP
jgi:hypothetical protein